MQRAGAVPGECREMGGGSVPFVCRKSVRGMLWAGCAHQTVARDLGEDRCGADARLTLVSANDGTVRVVKPEFVASIDEEIRGRDGCGECGNCILHCPFRCAKDTDGIDGAGV